MEAVFSNQHSAVSENQNQHQSPSTAKDAEDAKEEKILSRSHGKPDDEEERVQQQAQALALKLAQTYEELSRLLERNPGMKRQMTEGDAREDKIYQRLKQRLKMADMAPRCQWVKQDGTACRSPQMKQHIYCFSHRQMAQARELMLMLPVVEDANAIQVGLMRIQKALIEDTISMKKAGLLLYSMQLAMTNVARRHLGRPRMKRWCGKRWMRMKHSANTENLSPQRTQRTQRRSGHRFIGTSGHLNTKIYREWTRMSAD